MLVGLKEEVFADPVNPVKVRAGQSVQNSESERGERLFEKSKEAQASSSSDHVRHI